MACYFAAFAGMGVTRDELFGLLGSDRDDGPMLGECAIELLVPFARAWTTTWPE